MVFPVIHSTLDPKALTQEIARRYALPAPVQCQLVSRANNDFYEVKTGSERYALRVAKADFRSRDEYAFELAYVDHIHQNGCRVPAPIRAQDGSLFFDVEAPEGIRSITLMQWLDGVAFTKSLTDDDATQMGSALAALHLAAADFQPSTQREISTPQNLDERMPDLLEMLSTDTDHRAFYAHATSVVKAAYDTAQVRGLPRGPVHGDYQFANVMRTGAGDIAVLDFDTCGVGCLAEDLFTFVWRSDMEIKDESINTAFIAGYEEVRPLTEAERSCLALFRVARDLVMSSTFAMLINRVGPVPGFDGDFAPFTDLARQHFADAGLE